MRNAQSRSYYLRIYAVPNSSRSSIACIICFASSYRLRLGYYAPCFVGLTEPLGGELNAALVQACAFGIAGSVVALAALSVKCAFRRLKAGKSQQLAKKPQRLTRFVETGSTNDPYPAN